jgi:hypothetical protein
MVDEGRCDEATSNPWSLRSIASWRDAEGRLELLTAPACFGSSSVASSCGKNRSADGQMMRTRERKIGRPERRLGKALTRRI